MEQIKAIIVDDEESARDVLGNLLKRFCPEVNVIASCNQILNAVVAIKELKPDLVFLDIEMPNYAGFEITKFFDELPFDIIFISAYNHYAIRAFEISATDYLLKPVDIERLKMAVGKVIQKQTLLGSAKERLALLNQTLASQQLKSIAVIDKGQHYILSIEDIIAIEAMESYCLIHTPNKKFTVSKNLKHYENLFQSLNFFFRTHKSWLINLKFVAHYSKANLSVQLTEGLETKLSKYKKQDFETIMHNKIF